MTNILLGGLATLLFLAGCESKVQNPSNENIEKSISSTDDTIIETAPPEDKFVYDQDGIIVCEEDETGMCLDDSLQDLRAAQLMERQYVTNASGDQDELGEYGDIADSEYGDIADEEYANHQNLPPIKIWGRDLSNTMAAFPQDAQRKYGDRKLIINGSVTNIFTDGVTLGNTFVGVSSSDLKSGDVITVYCTGAYPVKSSWAITTVAKDCFR